jgi:uncharacterized protein
LEPVFFSAPALFGAYHPALVEAERPLGVLLCPPIGHEHTRSHRAIKSLAEALARAGHHVLRFDYTGVGDSAGELADATVATWCDDVARAVQELGALSGMRDIRLVGLRLGSALALRSLASPLRRSRARVNGVVLWDPVLWGGEFLGNAERLHTSFVRDPVRFPRLAWVAGGARPAIGDDRLGYSFAPSLRESLLALDLRDPQAWPPVPAQFVMSEPNAEVERLRSSLQQCGRTATCIQVPDLDGNWADYARHEKPLRAGRVVRAIVDCLEPVRS